MHFEHLLVSFAHFLASFAQNPGGLDPAHAGFVQISPAVFPVQASMDPWPASACVANRVRVRAALSILCYSFNWLQGTYTKMMEIVFMLPGGLTNNSVSKLLKHKNKNQKY